MKTRRRFRPCFDYLETRLALAVSVTQGDFDGNGTQDIRIIGDAAGQNLIIDDNVASITLSLDANGDGDFTDAGDRNGEVINQVFETFDIQLLEGSDHLTFNVPTTDYNGAVKSLLVDLGKQGDTFFFDASNGRDIISSSVAIEVVGGGGGDDAIASFDFISGSAVSVNFDLLGGADHGSVNLTGDVVAGSVMDVHVDLGTKSNTFTFQPGDSSNPTINNSTVGMDLVGGGVSTETDTINFFSSIKLVNNASLVIKADLGGGNDAFTGNLDLLGLDIDATSRMRFDLNGDEGNDSLQLTSAGVFGNADTEVFGLLEVNGSGGAGSDLITVALGRTNSSSNMELDGTLRARLSGGSENDFVDFRFGTDATTDGTLDVVMLGNAGNDQLAYVFRDEGNTDFGPAGFALVDGGLGNDQTFVTPSGASFDPASVRARNAADPTGGTPGVTTGDFDGNGSLDLRILGTDGVQNLTLIEDPAAGTIDVELDLNGDGDVTDPGDVDQTFNGPFETVYIQMLGGKDRVTFTPASDYNGVSHSLLVDLGKGGDEFNFLQPAGIVNSSLTIEAVGGNGKDIIFVAINTVDDSAVLVRIDAGVSDDISTVTLNSIQNGSTVDIATDLGTGNNNGSLRLANVIGGSTLRSAVRGGNVATESDAFVHDLSALVDSSTVDLQADMRGGDDFLTTAFNQALLDVMGTANLRLHFDAGEGNDSLVYTGDSGLFVASTYTIQGVFDIAANGGAGNDTILLDLNTNDSDTLITGKLRVRLNGGGDTDTITTDILLKANSSGTVDLAFLGNGGSDTLNLTFFRLDAITNFGPAGFILLDGGSGADTGTAVLPGVPPPLRKRNCEA